MKKITSIHYELTETEFNDLIKKEYNIDFDYRKNEKILGDFPEDRWYSVDGEINKEERKSLNHVLYANDTEYWITNILLNDLASKYKIPVGQYYVEINKDDNTT